jgi:hypothetical protein
MEEISDALLVGMGQGILTNAEGSVSVQLTSLL